MEGVTLDQYLESLRVMVKQKTGRAMQEKDVQYTDKNGKVRTRNGASPIRECVVVIEKDTKLKDLLRFTKEVEKKWGIKALQVHLHRDEGHFDNPADENTWVPNYHAHIIWDWMDHSTGKSIKLNADDMSTMQDMVAEALDMERGQKKSETGLDHLEREQFIKQKLEKEKKQLEEEKRKAQSEKAKAENRANEAKKQAREAITMLITDKLPELVKTQVEAVKGINIDKVTVWDTGTGTDGKTATSNFISGLMKSVPPLNELFNMAGMELPSYLKGADKEPEVQEEVK